jgi:diacylglycerol kinase
MEKNDKRDVRKPFRVGDRLRSFSAAFKGIAMVIRYEDNARIHLAVLTAVIIAGFFFRITVHEWIAIVIVSGLVLMSECFNTAIENLSDMITTEKNENIRKAKDAAAAGVLISAAAALITGIIIFFPAVMRLIRS